MQTRQRKVLARAQRDHVKIVGNGWYLGGAVTEEGVRTFVRKFQVDRVRLLTWASPRGSANLRLSEGDEDGCGIEVLQYPGWFR